jgi:hypothetical protein
MLWDCCPIQRNTHLIRYCMRTRAFPKLSRQWSVSLPGWHTVEFHLCKQL